MRKPTSILALIALLTLLGCSQKPAPTPSPPAETAAATPAPAETAAPTAAATPGAEAEGPEYEAIEVSNGGTITGRIVVEGDIQSALEQVKPLETSDEVKDTCGSEVDPEVLAVKDGGVANAVVWISDIRKGKAVPTGESLTLDVQKCRFVPHVMAAAKGQTLNITNSDPFATKPHLYVHQSNNTLLELALEPGASKSLELKRTGILRANDDTHHWMQAWLYVFDHPYFDLTDEDGRYEITGVPPGAYTVRVWHEAFWEAPPTRNVEVKAGETVTVDNSFLAEEFYYTAPSGAEPPPEAPAAPQQGPGGAPGAGGTPGAGGADDTGGAPAGDDTGGAEGGPGAEAGAPPAGGESP